MDTNKMFIDMARQAREFAEMCCFMQKMPGMPLTAEVKDALDEYAKRLGLLKADPEAWRERNRQKQAAGVKFEWRNEGVWRRGYKGSIFTFDIGGEEDYREVPQLLPHAAERALWKAQREAGTNEVWQGKGIKIVTDWFELDAVAEPPWHPDFTYRVKPMKLTAKIARQIILDALHTHGKEEDYREVPQLLPHAAERALWKAQREAGTNEVWQAGLSGKWISFPVDVEPGWDPDFVYRPKPKPAKLTAKIARKIGNSGAYDKPSDWEFTGTIEEYRAECEKYGYAVVSEINEVVEKPKTEKYYFCLMRTKGGSVIPASSLTIEQLKAECDRWGRNIIGDIEEREVPIMNVINLKGIV